MEKKVLEMYVSPALEVVELEVKSTILSGSDNPGMNGGADNVGGEGMGDEE
jgi:hypothetical protein